MYHDLSEEYVLLFDGNDDDLMEMDFAKRFDGNYYDQAVTNHITRLAHGDELDICCSGDTFIGYMADNLKEFHLSNKEMNTIKFEYSQEGNYSYWQCRLSDGSLIRFHL